MKYAILIYGDESGFADAPQEAIDASMAEWWNYEGELQKAGVKLAGEALQPTGTGKSIRVEGGKASVTDGPFAETKEQLGGFYLLKCENVDEAIEAASRIPSVGRGSVEVRPVMDFSEQPS